MDLLLPNPESTQKKSLKKARENIFQNFKENRKKC
jgi:hypothetical protein